MNPNVQQFARIGAKSMLAWFKVSIAGSIITLICLVVSIFLYGDNRGAGFSGAGHAGGIGAILGVFVLFAEEFWTALLLFGSITAMIFYFAFANKYALHTIINGIWREKLSGTIVEKVRQYITALSNRQPDWLRQAGSAARIKMQLLQKMREDASLGAIQRRALAYGFKKAALQDIDFSRDEVSIATIVTDKLEARLNEAAQPSMKLFWIVAALQLLVLILALVYNHQ